MSRAISWVVLLVLAGCATMPEPEMRRFEWGMSRAELGDVGGRRPVIETADQVVYHTTYAGLDTTLTYRFTDDGLVQVRHLNREGHDDRNAYIRDFQRIKDRLIERYGLPRIDRKQWRNRLFAERPERWGDAVAAGHLVYYAAWETERFDLVMTLHGDRLQVAHEIVYSAPGLGSGSL